MSRTLNARLPLRVEQKLAEYCARHGVSRSEAAVRALDEYLDRQKSGADAYSLAADLIPTKGAPELQARAARKLARDAFRGTRAR